MRFRGLGVREAVALVALAGGLAMGVAFCDPSESDYAASPPPRETPTRLPAPGLSSWRVTFVEQRSPGDGVFAGQADYPSLDLVFEHGPLPDIRDDHWSLFASATFAGEPGRRLLHLRWTGELALVVNGDEVGVTAGPGPEHEMLYPFEQASAPTEFTIRLADTGGAVRLSAVVLE